MKSRNFLVAMLVPVLVLTIVFSIPVRNAYAACSDNGYLNSKGKCATSFSNYKGYSYESQKQLSQSKNKSFYDLIERLQTMIGELEKSVEDKVPTDVRGGDLIMTTRSAVDVSNKSAFLRGRVLLNGEDEAKVYFEYGDSKSDLDKKTSSKIIEDSDSNFGFSAKVNDLKSGKNYYYRAVGLDESGNKSYGDIVSFRATGVSNNSKSDNLPDLETSNADNITEEEAELNGTVDMNGYDNGTIFFVYGENKALVSGVDNSYDEYTDIDEDGDDIQKFIVDKDLDDSGNYKLDIDGLDDDTKIYFTICAEFEDDNGQTIDCGNAKSFTTDEL